MRRRLIYSILFTLGLTGCAGFGTGRNFLTESIGENDSEGSFFSADDFPVMAGDSGRGWGFNEESERRGYKTPEEKEHDRTNYALERELVALEDSQSESNLELYSLHKHKFHSTSEKIFFLKLPKGERRDYLVSKGMIKEQKNAFSDRMRVAAIRQSDVMMGMTKNDVMDSWGRPARVEVAGNPTYENERWAYNVNGATKYIYFEGGKVGGWE